MKKKSTIVLGTVGYVLIGIFAIHLIIGAWAFTMIMTYESEDPPKPQITYGEFPFKLVYELNGETKVIEDTIVCKYDGVEEVGYGDKINSWKKYLKSGGDRIILLDLRHTKDKVLNNRPILDLYFNYGQAEYYMGESERERIAQSLDVVSFRYKTESGKISGNIMSSEEAWEKYKIRLISWECAPPIENEFV